MQKDYKLQQQLYTLAFMDLSVKNILDSSLLYHRPEWLDTCFLLFFFACIGWKFLLQRYTVKTLAITAVFGVLFAYVSFKMSYFFLLFTFCGIAGCQNIDLRKTLRYTSMTKILMLLAHVIPYIVTAIFTPEQITYYYRNGVQRQAFFIGHPNTFSMYVGWAALEFIYAYYSQLKRRHLILIWFVIFLAYKFTDSNTSILVGTLCILLFILERAYPEYMAKLLTPPARYSFAFFAVFFTVITVWFTRMPAGLRSIYMQLNDFFTGRLIYGSFTYEHFGIAWLGNLNVHLSGTTYFEGVWVDSLVYDNAYIYLLVYYGAVFLPIFSIAFILIGRDKVYDPARNVDKILILAYALFAIMENYIINAVLCFPALFIGKYLFEMYDRKRAEERLS